MRLMDNNPFQRMHRGLGQESTYPKLPPGCLVLRSNSAAIRHGELVQSAVGCENKLMPNVTFGSEVSVI